MSGGIVNEEQQVGVGITMDNLSYDSQNMKNYTSLEQIRIMPMTEITGSFVWVFMLTGRVQTEVG